MTKIRRLLALLMTGVVMTACAAENDTAKLALAAVQNGALLVDVRTPEEFASGHLPGAINIPHGDIVAGMAALAVEKSAPVVLYCRSGNRSGIAETSLAQVGYTDLLNAGGYAALKPTWDESR